MTGAATRTRRAPHRPVVATSPERPAHDRLPVAHVLAAMALAAGLRAFHLGAQSLWIDEVLTWLGVDAGRPLSLARVLEDVHGPLYGVVVHLWTSLARGDSEVALRMPSLLAGVATVPALAWLAHRWLGRGTAAWAAWLAAASPFLVWYGQEARNYSLFVLCVCLAGAVALGPPGRARTAGYLASAWAGLLSNFSFALLAPVHLRWWMAGAERGRRARRLGGALAVALALGVLLAPWAPQLTRSWDWRRLHPSHSAGEEEAPLRGATTFHPAAVPYALHVFAVGYTLGPSLRELRGGDLGGAVRRHAPVIAATAVVFGLLGAAGLAALARRRRLLDAALWAGAPLAVVSVFALRNFKVFHPRYAAEAAPLLLLLVAAGLAGLRRPWRVAGALAVGLLWATSLWHHYFDPGYGKEDYRGAVRLVTERAGPDEKLLAVGAAEPIYYYYRGPLPIDRLWLGHAARPSRLEEELDASIAGARGTWIVLSRPQDLDPGGVLERVVRARAPRAEEFRFEGVRVWHLQSYARPQPRSPELTR